MTLDFRLKPEDLTSLCNLDGLSFDTTAEIKPLKGIIGQQRGTQALGFGLKMKEKGYNIYVAGMGGTGRSSFTNSIAQEFAKNKPMPQDRIYVYNFKKKETPKALSLLPGQGRKFKEEIEGIEILTGMEAGLQDEFGEYPEGTLNYIIMKNLETM